MDFFLFGLSMFALGIVEGLLIAEGWGGSRNKLEDKNDE